ncbi:twitching motility protein PilT [Synergistales bacterium]|nr:twitching motility protein PilT [Synergistales bacterium]
MQYLLDTHIALWVFEDKTKLSSKAVEALDDVYSEAFVSVASIWEVAIKVSNCKLDFTGGVRAFIEAVRANDFRLLDVTANHVERVEALPFIHRDPFDRLLIATAQAESMTLITADDNVHNYDVKWIW